MSFKNKVVLISGASSGIGATAAIAFAKEGANVVIVGRNVEKLQRVTEECDKTGNKCLPIRADVSNDEDTKRIVRETIENFGKIDVLINNAGIIRHGGVLHENVISDYDAVMNTNLRAQVLMTHLVAPYLIKTKGNIINISSVAGKMVSKTVLYVNYSMSKAAFDQFTRVIALELAPYGVRVNTISPGPVRTDILSNAGVDKVMEDVKKDVALGRISDSEEIADLILFLASDKAVAITGSDYVTDNGMLLNRQ